MRTENPLKSQKKKTQSSFYAFRLNVTIAFNWPGYQLKF